MLGADLRVRWQHLRLTGLHIQVTCLLAYCETTRRDGFVSGRTRDDADTDADDASKGFFRVHYTDAAAAGEEEEREDEEEEGVRRDVALLAHRPARLGCARTRTGLFFGRRAGERVGLGLVPCCQWCWCWEGREGEVGRGRGRRRGGLHAGVRRSSESESGPGTGRDGRAG